MCMKIPTFEEFLGGRQFDAPTLAIMKDSWNAAARAADVFMEDMESHDYGIAKAIEAK